MHDQKLRDQFDDWARPLRDTAPPPVAVLRRRARRRRARLAAAGASALAVTGVIVGLAVSGLPGRQDAATPILAVTARHPYPPGEPYLITLDNRGAEVRNEANGKVLKVLAPPRPGSSFTWVAAASDRLFVLADQQDRTGVAYFYALRLGAAGQVVSLRLVPHSGAMNGQIYGMAVSADGSEFAVATMPRVPVTGPARVFVYGFGGARVPRGWVSSAGGVGTLSWAGDTRLAFYWEDTSQPARSGLRILATTLGSGGSALPLLSQSRLAVPEQNNSGSAQLTADGSTVLTAVAEGGSGAAASKVRLGEFAAASGRLLRWKPLTGTDDGTTYCGVLWASRTGSTLITQCGHIQQAITGGKVTHIRLPMIIPNTMVGDQNTFAW
jgi:hypothetical protein